MAHSCSAGSCKFAYFRMKLRFNSTEILFTFQTYAIEYKTHYHRVGAAIIGRLSFTVSSEGIQEFSSETTSKRL